MLNKEKFTELLEKYTSDKISPEERSEFLAYVTSGLYNDLLLLHIESELLSKDTKGVNLPPHRAADILHKILSSEKQNALLLPERSRKLKVIRFAIAAAVIGAVAFSGYLITTVENKHSASNVAFVKNMEVKVNTSGQPLKMKMEEGSIVTLRPGSVIHYPAHFLAAKREIFLEGEAFFEVSKNAGRPFFVYNNNIVTRVLGTSFNVKMNAKTKEVEVSVRSGRVEVYEDKTPGKTAGNQKNNGVILLPNQKVIFEQKTRQFVPSLVDVPLPVMDESDEKKARVNNFVFEETPLKTVLATLEKSYGIEIVVDTENIYKCLFTGDVGRQDLYTRLDIICQSVQASYEVKGTKILIKGKGCE